MNNGTVELDFTLMEALMQYVDYGLDPGSGGRAVLLMNAEEAARRMHELSRHTAADMVQVVRNHFPRECNGSVDNLNAWMESGGIFGPNMEAEQVQYILGHPKYSAIKLLKEACGYKPMR